MPDNNLPAVQYYTPVELVGIYRSFLERGKSNGVVWLRGIYIQKPNQNAQWAAFYDELRDVDSNVTVTLKINRQDRSKLKSNSLVQVGGIIELNPFQNGTIQIVVNVTRYEIVKDQFVTEQDLKRTEIRIAKSKKGFKNVDAVLEDKLFRDERPKVALVFASTSITMQDFNAGVNAAAVKIDFTEKRQSFGNATILATFLQTLDKSGFDVIALVRGGGGGIEALDEIEVLQAVSTMTTPIICAIGHVGEELFMKSIADKVAPTPNGLGQYFSEMVEKVTAKRNNSRAALIEEVKKQFIKEIDESNKKNKELTEKLDKLTKSQAEQMGKLQAQLKTQTDLNAKQSKEFNDNLTKMQKTNSELNTSLQKLTAQNSQSTKDLNEAKERSRQLEKQLEEALKKNKGCSTGCLGFVAAIVTVATAACWVLCMIV
jgi:hypothetical protein